MREHTEVPNRSSAPPRTTHKRLFRLPSREQTVDAPHAFPHSCIGLRWLRSSPFGMRRDWQGGITRYLPLPQKPRKERSLTQQQVADHLGVAQQTLAHYEVGRARIVASLLPPLAEILDMSIEVILTGQPASRPAASPASAALPRGSSSTSTRSASSPRPSSGSWLRCSIPCWSSKAPDAAALQRPHRSAYPQGPALSRSYGAAYCLSKIRSPPAGAIEAVAAPASSPGE